MIALPFTASSRSSFLRNAALALACFLLAKLVPGLYLPDGIAVVPWAPTGLMLAALLVGAQRFWPGVLAGALASSLAAGISLSASLPMAAGHTLAALAGVWLLARVRLFDAEFSHQRDYLWLGVAGATAASIGTLIDVCVLLLTGVLASTPLTDALIYGWQRDFIGIMLLAPLFLVWRKLPVGWFRKERVPEAIVFVALSFLFGQIVFLGWFQAALGHQAKEFLMFIFLVWGALRFGVHGTLLVLAMTEVQALLGASLGVGFLTDSITQYNQIDLWSYMIALNWVGVTLALFIKAQRRAEEKMALMSFGLNQGRDAVYLIDKEARILYANDESCRSLGYTQKELLGMKVSDVDPDFPAEAWQSHWHEIKENGSAKFESRHRTRGQRIFPVEITANYFEHGGRAYNLALVRDISERKAIQNQVVYERNRLKKTLDSLYVFVALLDIDGKLIDINQAPLTAAGLRYEDVVGKPFDDTYPWNYKTEVRQQLVQAIALARQGQASRFDINVRVLGGQLMPLDFIISPVFDDDGRIIQLVASAVDITERKRAEEAMQLAMLVYQNSSEAMIITDADTNIININPAFTEVTGYTLAEVIGKNPRILSSGRQGKAFYQIMWDELLATGKWRGELWDRRKNGEIYPKWLTIDTIFNEDGSPYRRVGLFSDITEKKKSEERIWRQANFDDLTGLPNRRMFLDRLQQEIKKAHRSGTRMALMYLDLDRFKEINDTLGHGMGDQLLKEAAQRLNSCVRESDTVSRLGGDEFTIILGVLEDLDGLERIAQNILQKLAEPFVLNNEAAYVTTSIGITLFPDDGNEVDVLLKNADQAMYASKNLGRNRFSYFTAGV